MHRTIFRFAGIAACAAILLCTGNDFAKADDEILFFFTGSGHTTLNGVNYGNEGFTLSFGAFVSSVVYPNGASIPTLLDLTGALQIPSAPPSLITDSLYAFDNQITDTVGFGAATDELDIVDPSLATFAFDSNLGPIFNSDVDITISNDTTSGLFTSTITSDSFHADLIQGGAASTPEPGVLGLAAGMGFAALFTRRSWRLTKRAM
jgi:hypothetical protein